MLTKEEFVRNILAFASPAEQNDLVDTIDAGIPGDFAGFDVPAESAGPARDIRFAQLLLEKSGFPGGETLLSKQVILGDQKTSRFLPPGAAYWPKADAQGRPFHILLFDLKLKGSDILKDRFCHQNDQLEDALYRIIQDVLEGFERRGEERTSDRKWGKQTETLCVVSVLDDRPVIDGRAKTVARQLVCFGTKCIATNSLEVFTLREEARDWPDEPLAKEHLEQLFERHFRKLSGGAKWQEAFVSGEERNRARALMAECARLLPDEKQLRTAIWDLLDEIAGSFGLRRKGGRKGHRLVMHALPENHSIAVEPEDARKRNFRNSFQGLRIFDADERLIGYIVYVLDKKSALERLREQLAQHNHFHNVLVVYANRGEGEFDLWQGSEPLRGRLIKGSKRPRFEGEGGVVQLLARFFVVGRSGISTPGQLATELAWRAQHLKALAIDELYKEKSKPEGLRPLRDLLDVFNRALASLDEVEFADAYAQTISYGLLAARWLSGGQQDVRFVRKNIDALLPSTSPFLHDLFQKLVNSQFDQNLSWLLDDITSLLSRTMVADVFKGKDDPIIHFYEDFLDAYDPQVRKDRGVYYTPDQVVAYIVRSTDDYLREELGLTSGLADTTTWGEYAERNKVKVPDGVDANEPFVQILDPALGTGTFLKHTIQTIQETMFHEWQNAGIEDQGIRSNWRTYVREHLLPRLNGFEIMIAPYVVAHLRLGLLLEESGFDFEDGDRLRIFLTNTLEQATGTQFDWLGKHVAEESREAEIIKNTAPILAIIGNPPYSGHSSNGSAFVEEIEQYKHIAGSRIGLGQAKWIHNDYVKFIRFAELRLAGRPGFLGLITDHGYLRSSSFRGLRWSLIQSFPHITVIDLHGNLKTRSGGDSDESVFEITQGTCMFIGASFPGAKKQVSFGELIGTRTEKLTRLELLSPISVTMSDPSPPYFLFESSAGEDNAKYDEWPSVLDFFRHNRGTGRVRRVGTGFVSTHDQFAISWTANEATSKVQLLLDSASEEDARESFKLCGTNQWNYDRAVEQLEANPTWQDETQEVLYRPFDRRWTVWNRWICVHRRTAANDPLRRGAEAICVGQAGNVTKEPDWNLVLATRLPVDFNLFYRGGEAVLPDQILDSQGQMTSNLDVETVDQLLGEARNDVLAYLYALLWSSRYRSDFAGRLAVDYPRIPFLRQPVSDHLTRLGRELLDLHTGAASPQSQPKIGFTGEGREISKVGKKGGALEHITASHGMVRINKEGFVTGIPTDAWEMRIGGYRVLHKWMDSRKRAGECLTDAVLGDFGEIVAVLMDTQKLMKQLDGVLERGGCWSAARRTSPSRAPNAKTPKAVR